MRKHNPSPTKAVSIVWSHPGLNGPASQEAEHRQEQRTVTLWLSPDVAMAFSNPEVEVNAALRDWLATHAAA